MSELGKIISGDFPLKSIDQQVKDKMYDAGINPPSELIFDGQIHRFSTSHTDRFDTAGWYVLYKDNFCAGAFGCWRQSISLLWRQDIGREYTVQESIKMDAMIAEAKQKRDNEKKRTQESASEFAQIIWNGSMYAPDTHNYLSRKGIKNNGAKIGEDGRLIVPLYDISGKITSLQYIDEMGVKRFHTGGKTKGCFHILGEPKDQLFICEGFATGATIFEETGIATVISYSANNLEPTTAEIRKKYPDIKIIIVADKDESGVGQNHANQSASKHNCFVIIPPIIGDVNDYRQNGGNVLDLLTPKSSDWLTPIDDWLSQPAPIKWHVRNWLQENALTMVHGQSGSGKTFVVLDIALTMATGGGDWFGNKVKSGAVVYLAGEGHHGLRSRIALWCQEHKKRPENMWVSNSAIDLNTDVTKVIMYINSLPKKPSIVVVDTLHRFMFGDENSAQDAKSMIDACDKIKREFGCTVILVHHTGVSETAQTRARGSSAWRGALENEISVCDGIISAQKIKDAERPEDIEFCLESRVIDGWYDEEGFEVKSAMVVKGDKKEKKQDKKIQDYEKMIEKAWIWSGKEKVGDNFFLSRSAFIRWLVDTQGKAESTAVKMMKPSIENGFMAKILEAEFIIAYENGYKIIGENLIFKCESMY